MIRLRPKQTQQNGYPEDTARIVAIMAVRGYFLSVADAETIWGMYSSDACASWLFLDYAGDDDGIAAAILEHAEVTV